MAGRGHGIARWAQGMLLCAGGAALAAGVSGGAPPARAAATPSVTYRYEVAVRGAVRAELEVFAAEAGAVLADTRGWSLGGAIGFERVAGGGDFNLWLAAPDQMRSFSGACSPHYSCRAGRNVVLNDRRWQEGSGAWPGALEEYRRYVVNHEVGHWLGESHRACAGGSGGSGPPPTPPGTGQPAPVMMQQSKGLAGCTPQAWPLPGELASVGARHLPPGPAAGPPVTAGQENAGAGS